MNSLQCRRRRKADEIKILSACWTNVNPILESWPEPEAIPKRPRQGSNPGALLTLVRILMLYAFIWVFILGNFNSRGEKLPFKESRSILFLNVIFLF